MPLIINTSSSLFTFWFLFQPLFLCTNPSLINKSHRLKKKRKSQQKMGKGKKDKNLNTHTSQLVYKTVKTWSWNIWVVKVKRCRLMSEWEVAEWWRAWCGRVFCCYCGPERRGSQPSQVQIFSLRFCPIGRSISLWWSAPPRWSCASRSHY